MKILFFATFFIYIAAFALTTYYHISNKKKSLAASKYILLAGLLTHSAVLALRTYLTGHAPMASMYETLLFYSWTVALVTLIVIYRYKERTIELITVPAIVAALIFSHFNETEGKTLTLILRTRWFEAHVISSFAAYALFTLAFAAALLYLINRKRNSGEEELARFQSISARAVMWGFLFFSTSMLAGAVWGYLAWGAYWMWEPKIIWSFIVWFYYAGIMHASFIKRWRGTGLAIATVIGIFVVLFTYLGVGLLMKSSHNF